MIVSLQGVLVSSAPLSAVVDVHGVGYEVNIPVTTAEKLPGTGKTVLLHTVAVYREDSQALYGFSTVEERDFFRLLVSQVSGVGPKVALNMMSWLSLPVLRAAIADGDIGLLSKCHGVGKKTAERVVVELKDKLGAGGAGAPGTAGVGSNATSSAAGSSDGRARDAVLALTALGYKLPEAEKAVRRAAGVAGTEASTEDLVRRALGG